MWTVLKVAVNIIQYLLLSVSEQQMLFLELHVGSFIYWSFQFLRIKELFQYLFFYSKPQLCLISFRIPYSVASY